jgi:hypothetical protein
MRTAERTIASWHSFCITVVQTHDSLNLWDGFERLSLS